MKFVKDVNKVNFYLDLIIVLKNVQEVGLLIILSDGVLDALVSVKNVLETKINALLVKEMLTLWMDNV